jgi:hypothetical protein
VNEITIDYLKPIRLEYLVKPHDAQFNDLNKTYYFGIAVPDNDGMYRLDPVALTFKLSDITNLEKTSDHDLLDHLVLSLCSLNPHVS